MKQMAGILLSPALVAVIYLASKRRIDRAARRLNSVWVVVLSRAYFSVWALWSAYGSYFFMVAYDAKGTENIAVAVGLYVAVCLVLPAVLFGLGIWVAEGATSMKKPNS